MRWLGVLFVTAGLGTFGAPAPVFAQNLTTFGTPGLIDMPTAEVMPDGEISSTITRIGASTTRATFVFQFLPRIYGSFRYSHIGDLGVGGVSGAGLYDRSFDIHFQLRNESRHWPAIAVGLRDVLGTGFYSGEYIVATRTFRDQFKVTGGLGWGRLAQRNRIGNPLCFRGNRFCTRGTTLGDGRTGTLSTGEWFRGPMGVFGGISYQHNDRLAFTAEISSDAYELEIRRGTKLKVTSPFNFGVSYKFNRGAQISGYFIGGHEIGVRASYVINPKTPNVNAGVGPAPPAILPVDQVAAASWNLPRRASDQPSAEQVLKQRLTDEGIFLEGYEVSGDTVSIRIENRRYDAAAQALGRTNRALANTMPAGIRRFEVVLVQNGVPITAVSTNRANMAGLENHYDGNWLSLARARIDDGTVADTGPNAGVYPRFDYRFSPYVELSYFDVGNPLAVDLGVQLSGDLTLRPGLSVSGQLRYPVVGNVGDVTFASDSVIPHVRSDWALYAQQSTIRLEHLTADYIWRPGEDVFARVTAGYLEPMFGGVSSEVLWYPSDSRLAVGGEVNWTRQRDFDMLFNFRDYDVATGHASAYYEFDGGYLGQLDMGRYLAGDWGATFTLNREFNNGFSVGAFFSLTDVSFDDFGEGSFDKGFTFSIPLSWISGKPSNRVVGQVIRPLLRDGGARLNIHKRLYHYTRNNRKTRITERWARYYR